MFHLPTRISFGPEALKRAETQIAALGTKALIVTGKTVPEAAALWMT